MKKLFISQPMAGKTDEEILAVRKLAIKQAQECVGEDVEVIDSFFQDHPTFDKPLKYLAASIALLADADIAYFTKDWGKPVDVKLNAFVRLLMVLKPLMNGQNLRRNNICFYVQ